MNASSRGAEPLPNTKLLTEDGNLAEKQVAGMHKYLDRALAAVRKERDAVWKDALASEKALAKALPAKRERLKKLLGVVDPRSEPNLEYVSGPGRPSLLAEIGGCKVHAVRWAVLPGIDAEGLLIEPKGAPKACAIAVSHSDQTPEQIAGFAKGDAFALQLAQHGCRVLVPVLIDRKDDLSGNPKLNRQTNLPHREFVYRMAYEMGRTLTGYEVQKVLAAVDWFKSQDAKLPIGVIGYGDGGMIALYAAAIDERLASVQLAGYFNEREKLHQEPIDRNVWGLLTEFGDAELGAMASPRQFDPGLNHEAPKWAGPVPPKPGRAGAAPGTLGETTNDFTEEHRYRSFFDPKLRNDVIIEGGGLSRASVTIGAFLSGLGITQRDRLLFRTPEVKLSAPEHRHKRQFNQLVSYTQKLWRDSDATRKAYWTKADASSPAAWEKSCDTYRDYFHTEVIGKLPEPTMPLNPRTRQVYDEKTWAGYEVLLDCYEDVFATGILLLPKDLKPGEKRPVVVCQHGLEGTPRDTIEVEKRPVYNHFSRRLVELGYIVYAPQNPYYGKNTFRQLQRKANPLKLSLFSFIVRQHQRTLDWLETLPNVDSKRIAFYGLSYGGKTAMRVPAVEKRYCLSICSGDFNEWIGKNVSVDLDRSYMWTGEYEMYEFDLGNTFNYAEMTYLIAPRPFMVERGHDDGVGTDEMVAYEYAKVRHLYANRLKIPERTAIEFFPGGHQINAKDTFAFLTKHLDYPK
ncbi:dienelactone hydrolase family protein [Gemmata sp. JC717]|uniref:alpha/beta hydrolase family protein n=1 Tax=Gemmata algarum TaxID=2975278 RepID=UPI0021BB0373|nr:dienelactone hydrolase family protein [Gemmata algarum]MDY3552030.1 dienelactone hydrolase family protein [Gemmata algarum]